LITLNATKKLHEVGQSLWLDNITRELLNSGNSRGVERRIDPGLNPTVGGAG